MTVRARFVLFLACLSVLCAAIPAQAAQPAPHSILFVGNSLTHGHNVPSMVRRLAGLRGVKIHVETVAFPNFSLADHLVNGRAVRALKNGRFDVIVLQQGPSALEESRNELLLSVSEFAAIIATRGGRPAVFAAWPSLGRWDDATRASESAKLAAEDNRAILLDIAGAWQRVKLADPTLALHGTDGLHASPEGALLAALVIDRQLYGEQSPRLSDPAIADRVAGSELSLSKRQLRLLLDAAGGR